jgi:hypothetical protein
MNGTTEDKVNRQKKSSTGTKTDIRSRSGKKSAAPAIHHEEKFQMFFTKKNQQQTNLSERKIETGSASGWMENDKIRPNLI